MERQGILGKENFSNQEYYVDLVGNINDDEFVRTGQSKKFIIVTFGCQMNEHDSENIKGMLANMGYEETNKIYEADVVLYNTCAIRENAETRFFGNIGALKNIKKNKPNMIIATCGCMMQEPHIVKELTSKYKHVNIIFGTHNIYKFPELLYTYLSLIDKETVVDVWDIDGNIVEGLPSVRRYDFKAFVNIMYGCNNFCTYCIVPFTRGRERSRLPKDILDEVKLLAQNNVKEITLLGQNVNSYGNNFTDKYSFPMLLEDINKVDNIKRIRFMTSHPKDISDELIESFGRLDKLCDYLHLPVQAGSDSVLKRMNRKYTAYDYMKKIEKIKKVVPDIALTTDIIVGFPGETEEDFQQTLKIVKEVEYDSAFMFMYSTRKGTAAEKMDGHIDEEIKKDRFNRLLETANEIAAKKNKQYLGNIEEVLVEGFSKKNESVLSGRNTKSKLINFIGDENKIGQLVKVKITDVKSFSLNGVQV